MDTEKIKTRKKIQDMTIMYRQMESGLQATIKEKETEVSN